MSEQRLIGNICDPSHVGFLGSDTRLLELIRLAATEIEELRGQVEELAQRVTQLEKPKARDIRRK